MVQEFSIEIPDKEADGILSSKSFEENTQAALNDIPLVDKAVNYILGQPDGTLHQVNYISGSMLIRLQLTELRFGTGDRSEWIGGTLVVRETLLNGLPLLYYVGDRSCFASAYKCLLEYANLLPSHQICDVTSFRCL